MVTNQEMNVLQKERHDVVRLYETKQLSDEEYKMKIEGIGVRIKEKLDTILNGIKKQKLEENKMAEEESVETPKVEEVKKKGKGLVEGSIAAAIAKALQLKTVKNIDSAAAKVVELKPEIDVAKAKARIKTSIRECKAEKGRWATFTWDEANFQLVEKA